MAWMTPAVTATLCSSLVLTLIFTFLQRQEGRRHLTHWAVSWALYSGRLMVMLVFINWFRHPALLVANQLLALWSGWWLLSGTSLFRNRTSPDRKWLIAHYLASLWIVGSAVSGLSLSWISLPVFVLLGLVFIWTGRVLMSLPREIGFARPLAGWTFVIWGLHKLDYPLLSPIAWLAPWGYLLGAVLGLMAAMAVILVNFRRNALELERSEMRFRQLAENISEVFWIGSPDWQRVDYVSPAFETLWGVPRRLLYEQPLSWLAALPDEDRQRVEEFVSGLQGGFSEPGVFPDYRVVRPDGSERWVRARYFPVFGPGENHVRAVVGLAEDITAAREAAEALRASEERYRQVVDNAAEALLVTQDGRIRFYNPRAVELSGLPEKNFKNSDFSELVHPDDRDMVNATHRDRMAGWPVPRSYDFRIVSADGAIRWVNNNVVSIDWEGSPAALNIISDITDRRRLEEQLRQSQKMEAVGTLAGGIAHDFNNILAAMLGYTDLARNDLPLESETRKSLDEVIRAGRRARDLVRQILSFSRRTDGVMELVRPVPLIRDTISLLRATIPVTVTIKAELDNDVLPLMAEADQIGQVVMNLATNAAQAMPRGGSLTISLEQTRVEDRLVTPERTLSPGDYVLLKVTDTGQGMEQTTLERAFDPFFTTKEPGQGTGLGLAVVHGIVERHGGAVLIDSRLGRGTVVSVFLPVGEGFSGVPGTS